MDKLLFVPKFRKTLECYGLMVHALVSRFANCLSLFLKDLVQPVHYPEWLAAPSRLVVQTYFIVATG